MSSNGGHQQFPLEIPSDDHHNQEERRPVRRKKDSATLQREYRQRQTSEETIKKKTAAAAYQRENRARKRKESLAVLHSAKRSDASAIDQQPTDPMPGTSKRETMSTESTVSNEKLHHRRTTAARRSRDYRIRQRDARTAIATATATIQSTSSNEHSLDQEPSLSQPTFATVAHDALSEDVQAHLALGASSIGLFRCSNHLPQGYNRPIGNESNQKYDETEVAEAKQSQRSVDADGLVRQFREFYKPDAPELQWSNAGGAKIDSRSQSSAVSIPGDPSSIETRLELRTTVLSSTKERQSVEEATIYSKVKEELDIMDLYPDSRGFMSLAHGSCDGMKHEAQTDSQSQSLAHGSCDGIKHEAQTDSQPQSLAVSITDEAVSKKTQHELHTTISTSPRETITSDDSSINDAALVSEPLNEIDDSCSDVKEEHRHDKDSYMNAANPLDPQTFPRVPAQATVPESEQSVNDANFEFPTVIITQRTEQRVGYPDNQRKSSVAIPKSWSVGALLKGTGRSILFSFARAITKNGVDSPIFHKCVTLESDKLLRYHVHGHLINSEEANLVQILDSTELLPDILDKFERMNTCSGIGAVSVYHLHADLVFQDYFDQWHHKACSLISNTDRSNNCLKLRRVQLQKETRFKKGKISHRVFSSSDPMERNKLMALQKRSNYIRGKRNRAKARVTLLRQSLRGKRE